MIDIKTKDALAEAIKNDSLIIFVGAGFSMKHGLPNWKGLIQQICEQLQLRNYPSANRLPIQWMLEKLENNNYEVPLEQHLSFLENAGEDAKKDVKRILYDIIDEVKVNSADLHRHEKLWAISKKIITTNYDRLLEQKKPDYITDFANDNEFQLERAFESGSTFLYKIHGDYLNPDRCILFNGDYEELYGPDSLNRRAFSSLLSKHKFLFMGFSLNDAYVNKTLDSLQQLFGQFNEKHFWVSTSSDREIESRYGIQTIEVANYDDAYDALLDELVRLNPTASLSASQSVDHESQDPNYYYDQGLEEQNNGRLKEAQRLYEIALELNPDFSNAYNNIGVIHDKNGNDQSAMEFYNKAINANHNSFIAWYNKGDMHLKLGQLEDALIALNRSIELNDNYYNSHYDKGLALLKSGKYQDAIKATEFAVQVNPEKWDAYINLGKAYHELHNYEEAINNYDKAIARNHDNYLGHYNKGVAYYDLKNFDAAIACFKDALKYRPNDADSHYKLGLSYQHKGNYEAAEEPLEKATQNAPNFANAWGSLGDNYFNLNKIPEAIAAYEQSIEINPSDYESLTYLGQLVMEENPAKALDYLDRSVKLKEDYDRTWFYKALHSALYVQDHVKTLSFMEKNLEINRNYLEYYENNEGFEDLRKTDAYVQLVEKYQESSPKKETIQSPAR